MSPRSMSIVALVFFIFCNSGTSSAQEPSADVKLKIIEEIPFDRITVIGSSGDNESYRITPVDLAGRQIPANPNPNDTIKFRLEIQPDTVFEVAWKDIKRLELYEQMVLAEAKQLLLDGKTDEAYEYLYFLSKNPNYANTPGLEAARQLYLYVDGDGLLKEKKYDHALGVFEELFAQAASFRPDNDSPTVAQHMESCIEQITQGYVDKANYVSARKFIERIAKTHRGSFNTVVDRWVQTLRDLATKKKTEAEQHVAAGRGHDAHKAVRAMLDILPNLAGGRELEQQVAQKFPLVFVAVSEYATSANPYRIDSWSSRRVGRLTRRTLVQLAGQGLGGGEYISPFGTRPELSDDERELTFRLTQPGSNVGSLGMSGYDVSQRLLDLASPGSPEYLSAWSRLVEDIRVDNVQTVVVRLRHSHILPEAFLQIPLSRPGKEEVEDGPYVTSKRGEDAVVFKSRPQPQNSSARLEVVEQRFDDSQVAVQALLRGEIDVIDRVFPAHVKRLRADPSISVEPYDLPTVHLLVLNKNNPFLNNLTFRRALVFGINRQMIVNEFLLGGNSIPGCQVLSGPFPAGSPESSAVGYAYDEGIGHRPYERRLASTFTILAERQITAAAAKLGEQPPQRTPLVLAHPASELVRVACQSIAQQLTLSKIEVELKQLPPGMTDDPDRKYDLLYVEAAVWEPLVDARRVLGPTGLARATDPYINLALRRLDSAQSLSEAGKRLKELHGTVHNDLTVIPLWQLVNHFARRKKLRGIGSRPLTLYDNIDRWQIVSSASQE